MTAPQASPADSYLAAQGLIASQAIEQIPTLLTLLDLQKLRQSTPKLAIAVQAIVAKYGRAAKQLAISRYMAARNDAGVVTRLGIDRIPSPVAADVRTQVEWAVSGLYGPLNDEPTTVGGKLYAPIGQRQQTAQTNLEGLTNRLVLDQGRDQIVAAVQQDTKATGYYRVPSPGCCYFCAMLASRGAVYKSDSFAKANERFVPNADTPSDAKTHDHCRCVMAPAFGIHEPSAQVRQWEADWVEATRGVHGSQNMQQAWRDFYTRKYGRS